MNTHKIMFGHMFGQIKLTHEINHHRCSQLIPETYEYVTFHGKMDFAGRFNLMNLR